MRSSDLVAKWVLFVLLMILAALIGVIHLHVYPLLHLEILFFIPVVIAAWQLGRPYAWVIVTIDVIPTYIQMTEFARAGVIGVEIAVIDVIVRLLVYGFVAELVYRLVVIQRQLGIATERLERAYEEIHRDVEAARTFQEAILENPLPIVPGFDIAGRLEHAAEIGGDFWELIREDDYLHITIGDVIGKGIQAALLTSLLKHLLDEARDELLGPSDLVATVNTHLKRRLSEGMFVSMFYGRLDIRKRSLSYVNAGHEPPLVYRRASDDFEELGPTAMVMGPAEYDEPPSASTVSLYPRDILLCYTDGAVEIKTPSGEHLGVEYIRSIVRKLKDGDADGIMNEIMREIEDQGGLGRDDVALLCVKAL